ATTPRSDASRTKRRSPSPDRERGIVRFGCPGSALADGAFGRAGPLAPLRGLGESLLDLLRPARRGRLRGLLLELAHPLTELGRTREGFGIGAAPLGIRGLTHLLLDGPQTTLEIVHAVARHLADRLPLVLQLAQTGPGTFEIGRRVDRGGSLEQGFLRAGVLLVLGVALGVRGVARGEEDVLGALEPLPQLVV